MVSPVGAKKERAIQEIEKGELPIESGVQVCYIGGRLNQVFLRQPQAFLSQTIERAKDFREIVLLNILKVELGVQCENRKF